MYYQINLFSDLIICLVIIHTVKCQMDSIKKHHRVSYKHHLLWDNQMLQVLKQRCGKKKL